MRSQPAFQNFHSSTTPSRPSLLSSLTASHLNKLTCPSFTAPHAIIILWGWKAVAVIGAFLASGMYHELGSVAMGRAWDGRVVWFFLLHGSLVILERMWRKVSGKRVGGIYGTLWVYFWVIGVGQFCGESKKSDYHFDMRLTTLCSGRLAYEGSCRRTCDSPSTQPYEAGYFPAGGEIYGLEAGNTTILIGTNPTFLIYHIDDC